MVFLGLLLLCLTFYGLIRLIHVLKSGVCRSPACLIGKTAIVTGGNSGIGFETCLTLASRGCKVIIADKDNSEKSCSEIIRRTKNPNIEWKHVDLGSFESIRKFAEEINNKLQTLDILINNAGIAPTGKLSEDHLDLTMQVNYFGPFLLTHLLVGKIKNSTSGRIVFTSSALAFLSCIQVNNFGKPNERIRSQRSYNDSKLATIVASDTLAAKLKNSGIMVNSVHPGMVMTNIFETRRSLKKWSWFPILLQLMILLRLFKDPYEGSQTTLHVAISEETAQVSGKYFVDCKPFFKPFSLSNPVFCEKIWEISEQRVGLTDEEKL